MSFLNAKEKATLTLLCDSLIPALEPHSGDDERLFRLSASDLDIPTLFEEAFQRVTTSAEQRDFRLLLRGLEMGFVNRLIAGEWQPFSKMTPETREKLLLSLANSRFEKARTAFLSVKRLACFLFYGVMPQEQKNPTWETIGYHLPDVPEHKPKPIKPLIITQTQPLETDVLIIGSGAGGGVVAGELAAAGHDVLIVEKGDYYAESDFNGAEITAMERMYEKYGALVSKDTTIAILAGSVLGGGTTVNWTISFKTPEPVLREWEQVYGFTGASSQEYQQSFEAVARRTNINIDESAPTGCAGLLEKGCKSLGYGIDVIPRNVKGCEDCGFCNYGCAFGAKQGTLKTYLQDAYDNGACIIVRAHVDRVLHERGTATGAEITVTDAQGRSHKVMVKAKVVVVSAGTIHTPAVLLRSGLTNANIGANLHLHPVTVISGLFDEPVLPWRGTLPSRCCFDFSNLDGNHFGVWLETSPAHPGINGLATPWTSGRRHKEIIQQLPNTANIIILARDRDGGRIKIDKNGQPVVHYRLSDYDAKHLMIGLKEALKIHVAAGAKEVATAHNDRPAFYPGNGGSLNTYLQEVEKRGFKPNAFALFSAHQMSSCRIAGDPSRGALDPTGQSYEVKNLYVADGSVLPSAPGVNPMVSIMTAAHFIAQHIKTRL